VIPIQDFVNEICAISESRFTHENVLAFLREHPVDIATLSPYLYFCQEHYTRNLIHRNPLFELNALCWEVGQKSPIHNHRDQNCWMAMAYGSLQVHNFSLVKKDPERHFCELKSSGQIVIDRDHPPEVDPAEPIHAVMNLASFNSKAVSLHVYSRPYDSCEIYDLKNRTYEDQLMINQSEFGKLKTDWKVEKVNLA